MSDDDDDDINLIAPLRMRGKMTISTKTKTTKKNSHQYRAPLTLSRPQKPQEEDTKATISETIVETTSKAAICVPKKMTLQDMILMNKCPLLHFLSTRSLMSLAGSNNVIRKHYLELSYPFPVSFHDLACILRVKCSFGVLAGCNLVVGNVGENVQAEDIVAVTNMLQNPKTQVDIVTFVEFNANISDVIETHVVEFLRSFRFPPLKALTSVNLEGSLIGSKGVTHFCSVLRKKCLPNLKKLNLSRNSAQDVGMKCLYQTLCDVDCCPLLEWLSLAANRAEESVLDYLCGQVLRSRPSLTHLDISDNNICLAEGKALVTMKSNKPQLNTLQSLDLSFNPVEDEGMHMLFSCGWGGVAPAAPICLQHLLLVNCNIGNKTFAYLGELLKTNQFKNLETLSLGMNNGSGRDGILPILKALCPQEARLERASHSASSSSIVEEPTMWPLPALRHFLVPLNNFGDEGLLAIMGTALLGGFGRLETLDVSDVGATNDTVTTFISKFVQHAQCGNLKKLVVFGRHPFAQRAIRSCHFPDGFLRRVKVS